MAFDNACPNAINSTLVCGIDEKARLFLDRWL